MEFLNYRCIKIKLKKKGILFKKLNVEDASSQFYTLSRQLDDYKLYSGLCHLAISDCNNKSNKTASFLNAARAFSRARHEIISIEDHIKAVIWIYTEALLICDRSFIKPICLEMGRFYESHNMYQQAAECFKQSMSISRCVYNLILAKRYQNALDELKNCPSHLMTSKDHTSMFLLELLFYEDSEELSRNSLQQLLAKSRTSSIRGYIPVDERLFDLTGLLESLLIVRKDKAKTVDNCTKSDRIKNSIIDKLSAFLDPAQTQLLHAITANAYY